MAWNGSNQDYGYWSSPPSSPPRNFYSYPEKPKPYPYQPNNYSSNPFSDLVPSSFPKGIDPKVRRAFEMADRDFNGFIDEKELKAALSSCGLNFSTKTVRFLMNTFTNSKTRLMGPKEFSDVFSGLQQWRVIFQRSDRDRNGKIDSLELRQALQGLDYEMSPAILDALIFLFDKNGGSSMGIGFEGFIECCLTVKGLTDAFSKQDPMGMGRATFTYETFMLSVLPFIVS